LTIFLVLLYSPLYCCQNDGLIPPPQAPRWSCHLSIPPLDAPALFWLVVGCKTINQRPSKARVYYNLVFFCRSKRHPNQCNKISPRVTHWLRLLFDIPPTAAADYYLIVVFLFKVLATEGQYTFIHLFFLMCLYSLPQLGKPAIAPPNLTTGDLR
jgi:hypothetical protein